jgi:hypothetical protein
MFIKQFLLFSGLICLLFVTAGVAYAQGTPTVSINDITIDEGDGTNPLIGWDFTVTLSAPSTQTVTVTASTQDGSAIGNTDYGAGSVVVTFVPGQTSSTLTVFVLGDTAVEGTENFFVNLSNPTNATIGRGKGEATIIDDDALLLLNQTNSTRGVAFDSVTFVAEPVGIITERNFSSDQRARLMVFAVGAKLPNGEQASLVSATAEDSTGTVRPLTVESARKVPNFPWLTQVVVKLTDQIVPGDVKIRITRNGQTSNPVLVALKAQ